MEQLIIESPITDTLLIDQARKEQEVGTGKKRVTLADIFQFLRFAVVGSLNTIIDIVVLNLLRLLFPTTNTSHLLLYNTIAVIFASANSFFFNKYWTFQKRDPVTFQEIYRFLVIAGATALVNDTLMWILSGFFPGLMSSNLIGANIIKLAAIGGTMSISFFGMRLWVFFMKIQSQPQVHKDHAALSAYQPADSSGDEEDDLLLRTSSYITMTTNVDQLLRAVQSTKGRKKSSVRPVRLKKVS